MSSSHFDASTREQRLRARTTESLARYERAQRVLAAGVSSGLRRQARPYPLFFTHGDGPYLHDVDGTRYIDYTLAWGPLILGHAPSAVADAIAAQARRGLTFGAQHDLEIEVAERLTHLIPCADRVAFANSGTEIVQVALRLARAVTGRSRFVKFEGHYHGWDDSVLVSYHPTAAQLAAQPEGTPIATGAGQRRHDTAVVAEWNDLAAIEQLFATRGDEIAAVICEPILCNSGCIPPAAGFLERLRALTTKHGALLIFDEVITGFRVDLGGAQRLCGVTPDLATYAKAVGGGAPLSVLAGKKEFMQWIAEGRIVHAGTLNGNPLVLAAARVTLDLLAAEEGAVFDGLRRRGDALRDGLRELFQRHGVTAAVTGVGPIVHVAFMERAATRYRDLFAADAARYADFVMALLDEGVMALPDGRWYLSTAHDDTVVSDTLAAVARVLDASAERGATRAWR